MNELTPITLYKRQGRLPLTVSLRALTLQCILVHPQGYQVIGTVRRGMNMGLLAIAPDGSFVRVNGWYVERLIQRAVCAAICKCEDQHPIKTRLLAARRQGREIQLQPQVVVRKRRSYIRPVEAQSGQYEGMQLPVLPLFCEV